MELEGLHDGKPFWMGCLHIRFFLHWDHFHGVNDGKCV